MKTKVLFFATIAVVLSGCVSMEEYKTNLRRASVSAHPEWPQDIKTDVAAGTISVGMTPTK